MALLEIFTNLQKNFQFFWPYTALNIFLNPYLPPRFLVRLMYGYVTNISDNETSTSLYKSILYAINHAQMFLFVSWMLKKWFFFVFLPISDFVLQVALRLQIEQSFVLHACWEKRKKKNIKKKNLEKAFEALRWR